MAVRPGVVTIAAAAVLIAGGLAAWRTLGADNGNERVRVATAPTAPGGAGPATGERPTPGDLSTGPVLIWTEITVQPDMGVTEIYGIESVGDGRIVARAHDDAGGQVIVTRDATAWGALGMPRGISPDQLDIAGDRWVVVGLDVADASRPHRVFYSDDQGAGWTELAIDITANATDTTDATASTNAADSAASPPYCVEQTRVESAMASGDRIVVVVNDYVQVDVAELLVARGLVADRDSITSWHHTGDTLFVQLGDGTDRKSLEVTHEELGLNPGQSALCEDRDGTDDNPPMRILANDGTSTEHVAEYDARMTSAVSTTDGFSITLSTPGGGLLVTSTDGRTWTERATTDGWHHVVAARGPRGAVWLATAGPLTPYRILRTDIGERPRAVVTFDDLHPGDVLAAGPAGVVTTARPKVGTLGNWIGWSVDGTRWGWQEATDAFGSDFDPGQSWVDFAVGDGFVLARVQGMEASSGGSEADGPPHFAVRWFIARVD